MRNDILDLGAKVRYEVIELGVDSFRRGNLVIGVDGHCFVSYETRDIKSQGEGRGEARDEDSPNSVTCFGGG